MLTDFGDGVYRLDSGFYRPGLDAIHLVVERGRIAIVDCGVNDSVPRVLEAIGELGLSPDEVDWLVLTHVHLDHAGGAGRLMRELPRARLLVHPRGARHMIDPAQLSAATIAVYGEEMARRLYGDILPVAPERVVQASDGLVIDLNGRPLEAIDTPGHARHHLCLVDRRAGVVFAGDTFGLSYRELDVAGQAFGVPSTTPVQFEPQALHESIDRIVALRPRAVALTHFGPVGDVDRIAIDLHRQIDSMVELATRCASRHASAPALRQALRDGVRDLVLSESTRQGWPLDEAGVLEVFTLDIGLNADGLAAWLARLTKSGAGAAAG